MYDNLTVFFNCYIYDVGLNLLNKVYRKKNLTLSLWFALTFQFQIHGQATDLSTVPPGRYRRTSVSHDWSDASVLLLSEDQVYSSVQQQQVPPKQQQQHETATASSYIPFNRRGSHGFDRTEFNSSESSKENHISRTSSYMNQSFSRRFSSNRLGINDGYELFIIF